MLRKLVSPNIQTMKKGFQVESVEFVTIEQPWNWQKTRYPDNPDKRISSLPVRSNRSSSIPLIPIWWMELQFHCRFRFQKRKKRETKGTHPDMEFSLRDRSIRAARHYRNCTVYPSTIIFSKEGAPTSGKHGLLATVFTIPWTCCPAPPHVASRRAASLMSLLLCQVWRRIRGIHYRGWQSTVKLARFPPPPFHGRVNGPPPLLSIPYSLLHACCS